MDESFKAMLQEEYDEASREMATVYKQLRAYRRAAGARPEEVLRLTRAWKEAHDRADKAMLALEQLESQPSMLKQ
jgi:hypothetical protein